MSKRLALIVALLLLLALSINAPAPVNAQSYDWSYTFQFSGTDYCFNIIEGGWDNGFGLLSNGASPSVLQANWQYIEDVYPAYVEVKMSRVLYNTANINLAGTFHVFGIQSTFNTTVTGGQTLDLAMPASTSGLHSNNINLAVQTDAVLGLIISEIRIYGNGTAPFQNDFNARDPRYTNCDSESPTSTPPVTPTTGPSPTPPATATFTPIPTQQPTGTLPTSTPTFTPSPTLTLTPSATATFDGQWCYLFDFRSGDDGSWTPHVFSGFDPTGGFGTYTGTAWSSVETTNIPINAGNLHYDSVAIDKVFSSSTLTRVQVLYDWTNGGWNVVSPRRLMLYAEAASVQTLDTGLTGATTDGTNKLFEWNGSITADLLQVRGDASAYRPSLHGTQTGTVLIKTVEMSGTGSNPFGSSNCTPPMTPTITLTPSLSPTPGPTNTPLPSNTPNPNATPTLPPLLLTQPPSDWCYEFDFRTGLHDWLITSGLRDAQGLSSPTSTLDNLTITAPDAGSAAYRRVVITFNTPFAGRAPNVMLGADYTFSTIYAIRQTGSTTPITLVIPFAGIDQFALDIDRDRFNTGGPQFFGSLRVQKIATYGTGTNPFGADNCAPAPTPTRQIIPTLLSPMPVTIVPSGTPLATWTLVATQTFVPTSAFTPTASATRDNLGIINPAFVPWNGSPSDYGVNVGEATGDLLSTGRSAVTFGENLIGQARGYLTTLTLAMETLGSGWTNAVPTEIPGLPKCSTQRFASEVCAIYYILTFTVLAGPIGSLIIPAATFAIFFWIVLAFVKMVVNILETLAKLQRVS